MRTSPGAGVRDARPPGSEPVRDDDLRKDGPEAIQLFTAHQFDLGLMDIQLPGCDRYSATETIRAWERESGRPPTPILALTADAMEEDRRRAIEAGCDAHLSKPIQKRTLLEAVTAYTARDSRDSAGPEEDAATSEVEEIAAVRPQYLRSRRGDLGVLLAARDAEDLETIRRLGHDMKGSGTSFGFPDVSEIGASIENAAKINSLEAADHAIGRLRAFLHQSGAEA